LQESNRIRLVLPVSVVPTVPELAVAVRLVASRLVEVSSALLPVVELSPVRIPACSVGFCLLAEPDYSVAHHEGVVSSDL